MSILLESIDKSYSEMEKKISKISEECSTNYTDYYNKKEMLLRFVSFQGLKEFRDINFKLEHYLN